MLSAAHPWAFAGLAALPLLWWWHRARQRPVEVDWPSLLLWKRLPAPDPAALAKHRRRADLALWLALAGVLLLVVGAAELSFEASSRERLRVGVVIDATASARGPFAEIRADADAFLKSLPGDAQVDLAIVPEGGWSALTVSEARERAARAEATDAPGDAAAAAARMAVDDSVVVFGDRPGAPSIATWRVHPAGKDEWAVEALTVAEGELFAVVRGTPGTSIRVSISTGGDLAGEEVRIPVGGRELLRRPAPGAAKAIVSVDNPDGFPANDARFWCAALSPTSVGIAGRDFPALRRALDGAGLRPELGGATSIWIGAVPDAAPAGPAVIIDPPSGVHELFDVEGELAAPEARIAEPNDAFLRVAASSDLAKLQAARVRKLKFSRPVRTLVEPYIYLDDRTHTLILAFDPSAPNSNWTRLVSFPLFWADAARLFRPAGARSLSTGEALPGRDGAHPMLHAGLFAENNSPVAVNLTDAGELDSAASLAAASLPQLDLPDKAVIRSRRAVPPAGEALAGLALLVFSWLAARPRRP